MIMMAGGAVVGVTYYSTTVTLPSDIGDKLELSSSLMYADGTQEIAKLGEVNRVYTKIRVEQPDRRGDAGCLHDHPAVRP
jgi:hypothetical protein